MPVINCKTDDLESIIPKDGKCIVDYYADWCGPCKMISPVLERISNDNVTVIKVNTETFPQLAHKAGVSSIPLLHFYENGVYKTKLKGAHPEPKIRAQL